MRVSPSPRSVPTVRSIQVMIAASCLLAVVACSTTPNDPAGPGDADASERPESAQAPEVIEKPAPSIVPSSPPRQAAPPPTEPPPPEPNAPQAEPEETAPPEETAEAVETVATAIDPPAARPTTSTAPDAATGSAPEPATAGLRGRVRLDVSQVDDVDADSVRDTVVYFRPAGKSVGVAPRNFEIATRRKRLLPDVMVIPVGSTVAFPNEDDILHNVFSVSSAADFDLGLYGGGESKSHTFMEPGLAVIHCNVHHAMRADVLIVDTPFYAQADAEGGFSLDGIEPTAGELVAWHPRAGFVRRQVTVPTADPVEIELTLVRPRIPDHMNKSGQPYRPERPGRR